MMKREIASRSWPGHHRPGRRDLDYVQAPSERLDPTLNYFSMGAMGSPPRMARARAHQSRQRIIVLDGDGSLLMNLGSLVTIAPRPKNLIHFVSDIRTVTRAMEPPIPNQRFDFSGSRVLPAMPDA